MNIAIQRITLAPGNIGIAFKPAKVAILIGLKIDRWKDLNLVGTVITNIDGTYIGTTE